VPSLALILAGLSLLIWAVLTFFRGAFWRLSAFEDDIARHDSLQTWPRVAAIVPARNEADYIAPTLESLIAQDYPGEFQIIIVDDHSEDATVALVQCAAQTGGAADRVLILQAAPLPPAWTGKLWALQVGIGRAGSLSPNFFWFTDADILQAPDTLRRLVARAESQRLDLASLMVMLQANTFPERLLMPAFLYFFLKLYPPKWTADPKSNTAGAAGGCILLRKEALDRLGGISSIRKEVIDDCALSRAVKRSGGTIWMGLTRKSVSLRACASFGEIRDLIARTAFSQLKYSALALLGVIAAMLLTYLVPVALTFHPQPIVWRMGLAAWALMTLTYLPTVRFYRLSPLWAPVLPLAAAFYSYSTFLSAVRYWLGRGGQWKGRSQAPARQSSEAKLAEHHKYL
jgi:hopene-associated glycosyltransferase HpnB